MAVGANSYGEVARVQAHVGDLVASRTFVNATSTGQSASIPSLTQVESWIDDRAARLNAELRAAGFTVPVSSATDPEAHAWLRAANSAGAAAIALAGLPADSFAPGVEPTQARGRGEYLDSEYTAVIKVIRGEDGNGRFPATRSRSLTAGLKVGSYQTSTGGDKDPFFTRGQHDFSATRSLIGTTT